MNRTLSVSLVALLAPVLLIEVAPEVEPSIRKYSQTAFLSAPFQTQKVYCRWKHKDHEKSIFSFGHRSVDYHLTFGNIITDGDANWFSVRGGPPAGISRIKDLGLKEWNEVEYVPSLPFLINCPETNGDCSFQQLSKPDSSGKVLTEIYGRATRIMAGHIYVLHIKCPEEGDFYALLRIDELKENDECTFSWRIVRSPEE